MLHDSRECVVVGVPLHVRSYGGRQPQSGRRDRLGCNALVDWEVKDRLIRLFGFALSGYFAFASLIKAIAAVVSFCLANCVEIISSYKVEDCG